MKTRNLLWCLLAFVLVMTFLPQAKAQSFKYRDSVVKVFASSNPPDFMRPWQSKGRGAGIGSGCIIKGNRILTNAHVVSSHTFIQLKKSSSPKKYTAEVEVIGHDCDLALLKVSDPEFFADAEPIPIGGLPMLQDTVSAVGFPVGGDQLSITEGVVSRVDIATYRHSLKNLLAVQIDAAINPGNSGGPVMFGDELVGIAFQGMTGKAENVGYMIPVPVINHFLEDLEDGAYDGFPKLGMLFNRTENPALRLFYDVENFEGGVLVTKVIPNSPADNLLKAGDILLSVDDIPIAADGTISFRGEDRIGFSYLSTKKQTGDVIKLKLVRGGSLKTLDLTLERYEHLVPFPYQLDEPPYYIFGGFIFTVLSDDLISEWGDVWEMRAPLDLLHYSRGTGSIPREDQEEVIVMLHALPDEVNKGYHGIANQIVTKVNGKTINSFKDLVLMLNAKKGKYTVIDTERYSKVILDNAQIDIANDRILARYRIPAQFSKEVADWLAELK